MFNSEIYVAGKEGPEDGLDSVGLMDIEYYKISKDLSGKELFLVCIETSDISGIRVVCGVDGQKLKPFKITNKDGDFTAFFVSKESLITINLIRDGMIHIVEEQIARQGDRCWINTVPVWYGDPKDFPPSSPFNLAVMAILERSNYTDQDEDWYKMFYGLK